MMLLTKIKLADLAVRTEHIVNSAIVRDKIVADAIDSTKLADNAVGLNIYKLMLLLILK